MTGGQQRIIQSVDDPAFSYGEYDYEYDYTFEDLYECNDDDVGALVEGRLGRSKKEEDYEYEYDEDNNDDMDCCQEEEEQSSIDGPFEPRRSTRRKHVRQLVEPNNNNGRSSSSKKEVGGGRRGKSKLDPPTLDDFVPCNSDHCYNDSAADSCHHHLSSAAPRRRRPKQDKLDDSFENDNDDDDDCCGILGLEEFVSDPLFEQHRPTTRSTSKNIQKHPRTSTSNTLRGGSSNSKTAEANALSGRSQQQQQQQQQHQLLCIHVCPHVDCNAAKCRPPDLRTESQNRETILKKPSFFYVPSELVLKRDQEMRQAAEAANIPKSRWDGSLLYHKWNEYLKQQQQQQNQQQHDDPVVITIHPVQTLARGHVTSPKFPWWQSWLTRFIRAYYNTGSLRIPVECQGLEVLLALEYFGILYQSPDQLIFDAPHVYHRVKQWSDYFTHRAVLSQWIVQRLQDRVQQQVQSSEEMMLSQTPFVFCSHPDDIKPTYSLSLLEGTQDLSMEVLDGGLNTTMSNTSELEQPATTSNYTSLRGKDKAKSSAQVVHAFFVPSLELQHRNNNSNNNESTTPPEIIPAMMRQDFACFLQHVLPDWEISFSLQAVQLVSTKRDSSYYQMKQQSTSLPSAVLVLTWNPEKVVVVEEEEKKVDPPVSISAAMKDDEYDDGVSCVSHSTWSSCEEASAVSVGATSISAAPTDEMAFGRLLNDTHKAVSRLLQHSTQEKAGAMRIGEENGFYFHKEDTTTKKSESLLDKTLDTTTSSSASFYFAGHPQNSSRSTSSSSSSSQNEPVEKRRPTDLRTGANEREPSEKLQRADQAAKQSQLYAVPSSTPSFVPFPTVSSQQWASIPADHIYADLYNDCLFPSSALEEGKLQIPSSTTMTQTSPLWTPSVVNQGPDQQKQTQKQGSPISSTTMNDHVSVTSSVTRSLLSSGTWHQAVQNARKHDLQHYTVLAEEAQEDSGRGGDCIVETSKSRQEDDAHEGGAQPFNSGQSRVAADKSGRKQESGKKSRQKKTKKTRTPKKNSRKSLLDEMDTGLGFNVSGVDIDINDIKQIYDIEKPTEESCQLLNDLYDFFVVEEKPSVVVVPPSTKLSRHGLERRSSLSSGSIGMGSISNQPEMQKQLRKRASFSEKKRLEEIEEPRETAMNCSDAMSSVLAQGRNYPLRRVQNNASTVSLPMATNRVRECKRVSALNKMSERDEEDEEAKKGIEVYHVLMSSKDDDGDPLQSSNKSSDHGPTMRVFEKEARSRGTKKAVPKRQPSSSKKEVEGKKKGLLQRLLRRK